MKKKANPLAALFGRGRAEEAMLARDAAAELLKASPEAFERFEESYRTGVLDAPPENDGRLFGLNAKQAAAALSRADLGDAEKALNDRIVAELLERAPIMIWDGKSLEIRKSCARQAEGAGTPEGDPDAGTALAEIPPVSKDEIMAVPEPLRPQLSGTLMQRDMNAPTGLTLLYQYKSWQEEKDPKKKAQWYHLFRQGLDILDLDGLSYEILGMNRNAMGHWLPALAAGIASQDFLEMPATRVIKVPITLLQLSRTDYERLTPGTIDILDRFCSEAFGLAEDREYFIKTGTFSSKFDFRNAKVSGPKEVRELGEYLMFVSYQAMRMAGPLSSPAMYGASTTNEWAVREYIPNLDGDPCIYKGLPLHTEFRLFADMDSREIIGMNPYWDPDVMKKRFSEGPEASRPDMVHDYIVYKAHEETLMRRYEENKNRVRAAVEAMLPAMSDAGLYGQWSVDVMMANGRFYAIDMALAENSAFYSCVPERLRKPLPEDWLPKLPSAEP